MKKSVKRSLDAYIRQMDRIDLRVIAWCYNWLNVFGFDHDIVHRHTVAVHWQSTIMIPCIY